MSERKKLAIIDGKSVFYRGFYAMPSLALADGTPTGGVYGFAAMSLELIKKLKPDYVCVAWDKPKTNIRKRLKVHPEYKAGRKPAPPDFYKQIPILYEMLEAFSWPLYEYDDYEADDIMHTLAIKAEKAGLETMLITSDLAALQSIDENTHVYALKKGFSNIERFDTKAFEDKYKIKLSQFLDMKSLKGDSSDNIPGVPGVGEKTAAELLQKYETLDEIYENIALIKPTTAKKLEAGKESALMSKEVARLYDDAPVELDLEAMDVKDLDTEKLKALLQHLEFRSLLRNLPEHMQNGDTNEVLANNETGSNLKLGKITIVDSGEDLKKVESLNGKKEVVLHVRSAGMAGKEPKVAILADEKNTYVLDLSKLGDAGVEALKKFKPESVIGHDIKASFKAFLQMGVKLPKVAHDTLLAGFLINSLQRETSLTDMLQRDLGVETELENLDDQELMSRAGVLASGIQQLTTYQGERMSELTGLIKVAEDIDWPIIEVLAGMEVEGIKLDTEYLNKMSHDFEGEISDIEQQIYGHADQEFNISSPAQLSKVLFEDMGISTKGIKKGKTAYSTAAGELDKIRWVHPIVNLITQYREYTKLKSTYVDALPKLVDENSRIHTTFNLTIAQTGRLSSTEPNLQNIPVRTEIGKKIREAFVVEEGNVLISADYSQFELRLAAALAGDEELIELFNLGVDIHTETAAQVYDIKPHEVTPDHRRHAKIINFGILYGMSSHGLSVATGMNEIEAKEFLAKYKDLRKPIFNYTQSLIEKANKDGYVETLFGRRRPMPDIKSSNYMVRSSAERAAMNMPIQGTEADLMKMAMVEVDKKLHERFGRHPRLDRESSNNADEIPSQAEDDTPRQLLQIHDSIMIECSEEQADAVAKMCQETMEKIYPKLPVKLKVDVKIGKTWGDL
jgi:DNA polymerase-1